VAADADAEVAKEVVNRHADGTLCALPRPWPLGEGLSIRTHKFLKPPSTRLECWTSTDSRACCCKLCRIQYRRKRWKDVSRFVYGPKLSFALVRLEQLSI